MKLDDDTYSNEGPECPYCGHQHIASEEPSHFYDDRNDTTDCDSCGREFIMTVNISYSWSCQPYDDILALIDKETDA